MNEIHREQCSLRSVANTKRSQGGPRTQRHQASGGVASDAAFRRGVSHDRPRDDRGLRSVLVPQSRSEIERARGGGFGGGTGRGPPPIYARVRVILRGRLSPFYIFN